MTTRFMIVVKADKNSEAGVLPDEKLLTEIGKDNEELAKAGRRVLWRQAHGGRRAFETKELIAGFWLIQV
jgi:hypothetical protein